MQKIAALLAVVSLGISQPQPSKGMTAYLTFDADMTYGMLARLKNHSVKAWYDPALIEYLEQNKIPATIFTTGLFAQTYPDLIKRLSKDGFSIENHSFDHPGFFPFCYRLRTINTDSEKISQIQKTQDIIQSLTGKPAKFFRFPGLCHSAHDDDLVKSLGLTVSAGDVVSADAFGNRSQKITDNVLKQVKDGSVILFHLGGPNAPKTFEAIKTIIPQLQKQGFIFQPF